jgi:murein DD-endopeptidase MepM/ murein hydrolase activator NlpD
MKSGIIEYYDFRLSTKLKNMWNNGIEKLWEFKYIMLFFGFAIMIITAYYQYNVNALKESVLALEYKLADTERIYDDLELTLKYETEKREVDIALINDKVNNLHKFVKRMYPNYDYKNKIDNALYEDKIEDLPESLLPMLVENKYMKPHGLNNYELTLKNLAWPMDVNTSFVATNKSEYGARRPYSLYRYKHEGLDLNSFYNDTVYSVYDATIWKKYYERGGGWTLEIKFMYESLEGERQWTFVRYRHLDKIYVKKGDKVKKGQIVASMGNTGYFSLGKHLHYELWILEDGRWVNINPVQNSTHNNKYIERLIY